MISLLVLFQSIEFAQEMRSFAIGPGSCVASELSSRCDRMGLASDLIVAANQATCNLQEITSTRYLKWCTNKRLFALIMELLVFC